MATGNDSSMQTISISSITFRTLGVFVALSFVVDLLVFDAIGEELRSFFLAVSIAKYLVPLAAWLVISFIQRRIATSLK